MGEFTIQSPPESRDDALFNNVTKAQPAITSFSRHGNESRSPPSRKKSLELAYIYLSIALLFINYFLAQFDKFVLSYFQSSILETLSISAPQYALLTGYSTGIVNAILALPVAMVADFTAARIWTLCVASAWWSLCVVFQGLAKTYAEMYCARLGMGIGQSAVEALSVSVISDLVGWRNAFFGSSVLYVGVYIGEAISGQIATAFTSTGTSWQVTMRAIGITGIVVAVLLRVVLREPKRRKSLYWEGTDKSCEPGEDAGEEVTLDASGRPNIKALISNTIVHLVRMRSFWLLVLSSGLRQLGGVVFGYYMPGYLSSIYPEQTNLLSRYGIIVGTVGSVSVLSGGLLTSMLWHKTKLTPLYLTAIGGMLSSVFVLLMVFSRDIAGDNGSKGKAILYGTMSVAYATAETWLGCINAFIALLLPPRTKTFGLAIWACVQILIYSSGPEIIGLALRDVEPGTDKYARVTQTALAVIIPTGYWLCAVGMLAAIPLVRRDLERQFVKGRLSWSRKGGIGLFAGLLVAVVIVLFTLSIVYSV